MHFGAEWLINILSLKVANVCLFKDPQNLSNEMGISSMQNPFKETTAYLLNTNYLFSDLIAHISCVVIILLVTQFVLVSLSSGLHSQSCDIEKG